MPLSRDPRHDRRRRVLLDGLLNGEEAASDETPQRASRARRSAQGVDDRETPAAKRSAGYSHSVRKACQRRLVQYIPIRKRSLSAAVLLSVMLPALLLTAHYGVFVGEWLPWKNHPITAALDASHPRGLAAWLASQLWLLCLVATLLTFQLRRHKLDDYSGEYRLWFWLVVTCLIGSIDSTTRITELFGVSLDRWSQQHVGLSGGALVQATLAVLIGILGLRLCDELKAVPTSLVLWLGGLVCWAGSAALAQNSFQIDLSDQFRVWLRATLWLVGLSSIWIAALFYLRSVYIEAQRRFILRGGLMSAEKVSLRQRLARAMPRVKLPGLPQRDPDRVDEDADDASEYAKIVPSDRGSGLLGMFRRSAAHDSSPSVQLDSRSKQKANPTTTSTQSAKPAPASAVSSQPSTNLSQSQPKKVDAQAADAKPARSWFRRSGNPPAAPREKATLGERFSWRRKSSNPELAAQQKVNSEKQVNQKSAAASTARSAAPADRENLAADPQIAAKRGLRFPMPRIPKMSLPKLRLPKMRLPSFRLPPPGFDESSPATSEAADGLRPVNNASRPLPGTSPSSTGSQSSATTSNENYARPMSKAERKKLRRLGRDDESERRAA